MRYFYGATEEKYVKIPAHGVKEEKLKPLDSYRFRLSPLLMGKEKLKRGQAAIRYRVSPDTLVELCSPIVNRVPLPLPFQWKVTDVADWIRKLGFPQYQNTFKKNYINGRTLIRMDASYLIKINIKNFHHIRIITKTIQKMYGFQNFKFGTSISLPQRTPRALYKFFRTRTGPKYERTRRTDYYRRLHLLRQPPLYETHWQTLERWLKHLQPTEKELIGSSKPRKNMLYYPPKGKPVPASPKKPQFECKCIPPCTCDWNLKPPWKLTILHKEPEVDERPVNCRCVAICTCKWPKVLNENGMKVLMKKVPHKYSLGDPPPPTTYDAHGTRVRLSQSMFIN